MKSILLIFIYKLLDVIILISYQKMSFSWFVVNLTFWSHFHPKFSKNLNSKNFKNFENFEARVFSHKKLVPQIRASFTHHARASYRHNFFSGQYKWRAANARASFPIKNWSRKSARLLPITRTRQVRVDTRLLPEAQLIWSKN